MPTHAPLQAADQSPSVRLVEAIAQKENTPPDELDPLYDVINLEALDRLFAPTPTGTARATGSVTFQHRDYTITVTSDGEIKLHQ